ncbi:unnamed protein product [Clonostachys rosea f. rosea IK726]|uniref:Uncharacterized protein n=1 Tax=Clonostachys rosea f. rosea IK726 TaxID=1349383 RepID=A0ACA9UJY8_BIOOC|nr:unnamed protein product [Clonostachys rosea f. rosea IK726]
MVAMRLHQILLAGGIGPLLATANNLNFDFPYNTSSPVPFTISVDEAFIEETQSKVKLYRLSPDLKDDSNYQWSEGPPQKDMAWLKDEWASNFDWTEVQKEINSNFSHYAITLQGPSDFNHAVALHFVHEHSTNREAVPLLLLHGWPSTHLEWSKIIEPLLSGSGASDEINFHLVIPDLPGFGFSPAPEYSGLGPAQMGFVFDVLMKTLGYQKYGLVSTDLGWEVASWMANIAPDNIIAHFTDFFLMSPNSTDLERFSKNETTQEESDFIRAMEVWSTTRFSYSTVHQQAPLAIGQAMADSPVGFAGWVWHLRYAVSDGYDYTAKELIRDTMMLWIQGPWGGLRAYKEFFKPSAFNFPLTQVPTGVSQWAANNIDGLHSVNFAPRDWMTRLANVVKVFRHDAGGHFPAVNAPDLWVQDVRQFFNGIINGAF